MKEKQLKSCYVVTKMLEKGMNEFDFSQLVMNMIQDVCKHKQKYDLVLEDSWVELCLNGAWYDYEIKDLPDVCLVMTDIICYEEYYNVVRLQPETYGIHIELNWKGYR